MLEVGIQTLLRIQLWAVAGQIKELDFVLALSGPRLDLAAVMHPQIIQNQKDFLSGILDQGLRGTRSVCPS